MKTLLLLATALSTWVGSAIGADTASGSFKNRNLGTQIKYMNHLAKEHPTQSVKITKGWSNGKAAVFLFDGESGVLKLTGEAILVNQGGTWRVDDEPTDVVLR